VQVKASRYNGQDPIDILLRRRANVFLKVVIDQIKKDRFTPLTSKLFGALGQLPSFYDRATWDAGDLVRADSSHA
jgi:hypothetical protein